MLKILLILLAWLPIAGLATLFIYAVLQVLIVSGWWLLAAFLAAAWVIWGSVYLERHYAEKKNIGDNK